MAKKEIGFVKLEWNCPNCQTRNPGPEKFCSSCGAAQPKDVQFEQAVKQELVKDQAELEKAASGPDMHCPYCGARNPAKTEICAECGGDLKEAALRESGNIVGAFEKQPKPEKQVKCPHCGNLNPESASTCSSCGGLTTKNISTNQPAAAAAKTKMNPILVGGLIIGAIIICGLVITLLFASFKTSAVTGTVQDTYWQRSIIIEEYKDVTREDWQEDIPASAKILDCDYKYRNSQDEPAAVSTEVCGTPYTVDEGSGFGKVVQDCEYEVYEEYCEFIVQDWVEVDEAILEGNGDNPQWPDPAVESNQRTGQQNERYSIFFQTNKGEYTYETSDAQLYSQCRIGSKWNLNINSFNKLLSIEALK